MDAFTVDIEKIRAEVTRDMTDGAVVPAYKADRQAVLKMLDHALATEWVCVLRYSQNAQVAQGIHAEAVANEFREHAREEQDHAEKLSDRIKQLGGTPDLDPATLLERAHAPYVAGGSLADMLRENLIAERVVVEIYGSMIRFIGDKDPTTRRLLEFILEQEEEHADDLADLLVSFDDKDHVSENGNSADGPLVAH